MAWKYTEDTIPTDFSKNTFDLYLEYICDKLQIKDHTKFLLSRVDDYHKHTFFIVDMDLKPVWVLKAINPESWDNTINMIGREIEISAYAYGLLPKMKPRKILALEYDHEKKWGIICYNYLGPAFTSEDDSMAINTWATEIYKVLFELHQKTVSDFFGFGQFSPIYPEKFSDSASYSFRFLLRDIVRDGFIEKDIITKYIREKWTPKLEQTKKNVLTHADITLSNVILTGPKIKDLTLIDWTYSLWQNPAYDLANVLFWHIRFNGKEEALAQIEELIPKYKLLCIDIGESFPCFLARKFLDYGRFNQKQLRGHAVNLLNMDNFNDVKRYLLEHKVFV